jgi:hypothetical protein
VKRLLFALALALVVALAPGCGTDGERSGSEGGGDSQPTQAAPASDGERSGSEDGGSQPTWVPPGDLLSRDPYMGVSCRIANSIECDRVGLAVWLRQPAKRVDASIAGRQLTLDDPEWSEPAEDGERRFFAGFLQPAGLIDGPLQVTPEAGTDRWFGREPVSATVELSVVGDDGRVSTTTVEVGLSPGWG